MLLKDIMREPYDGLGKAEALGENFSGFWSRSIDEKNRLIYIVGEDYIEIAQCRTHYQDS